MKDILVFTPTYNEAGNIGPLIEQVIALGLKCDIVVMDDGSPDGTAGVVQRLSVAHPNVTLIDRGAKLGIGTAHIAALRYANEHGYKRLVTLDSDFSHRPSDIPRLLELSGSYDIVVGTRFKRSDSLKEWNAYRRFVTRLGHFLTKTLLDIPYDASGGLRVYTLDRIPRAAIGQIASRDYEFFFESLTILHLAGAKVGEVPIDLPARTYGHSKMKLSHMFRGISRLLQLSFRLRANRRKIVEQLAASERPQHAEMRNEWDIYWSGKSGKAAKSAQIERSGYDVIATFYRDKLIKPRLNRAIREAFPASARLLHAGCGGGEVDVDVVKYASVTALDISPNALEIYQRLNGDHARTVRGDIFEMSPLGNDFDGIYNLGVMEHFSEPQIVLVLQEFNRRLKHGGKLVLFWPPVYGASVIALHVIHWVLNDILRRNVRLHPAEPTKVKSKRQVQMLLEAAGFTLDRISFGPSDAFTYAVVTATKAVALEPKSPEHREGSHVAIPSTTSAAA